VNPAHPSASGLIGYWLFVGVLGGVAAWYLARHYGRSQVKWTVLTVLLGPLVLLVLAAVGRPRSDT
jgi:hypothetical protein